MLVLVGSSKNAICYSIHLLQSDMTDFSVELGQPTAGGRARNTLKCMHGGIMAICLSSHSFIRNHFLAAGAGSVHLLSAMNLHDFSLYPGACSVVWLP